MSVTLSHYLYQWLGNLPEFESWLQLWGYDPQKLDLRHDHRDNTLDIFLDNTDWVVNIGAVFTHTEHPKARLFVTNSDQKFTISAEYPHNIAAINQDGERRQIATALEVSDAAMITASLNIAHMNASTMVTGQSHTHAICLAIDHLQTEIPDVDPAVISALTQLARQQTAV